MLEGYTISSEIHQGSRRIVHRATRLVDSMSVIIKSASTDLPADVAIAELSREYDILSGLSVDGVLKAYDLHAHAGSVHLILEDCGGRTLSQFVQSEEVNLTQRLRIAIDIANVLARVHAHSVIHKDINPTNILVEPSSHEVTLIDFSISTRQSEEYQPVAHPNVLEGTLAYLAPEQTGRMNRPIDYRSDFYSLGITLFELFTKRLPFQADDPMELVHCHMAVPAPSPVTFCDRLPDSLGMVIQKLLEKAPEDRYQSVAGIQHDLEACLAHIENGTASIGFKAGGHDVKDRFSIPTKLYGREEEIDALIRGFERVGRQGSELILVSGYSGIGKSSLVSSLQGSIMAQRGHFASGKFDQLQRTVPYSAIAAALSELVRQLLTDTNEAMARWKQKLNEAVGDSGQLIVDVIPEVEYVIGPQSPAPQLEGEGARNRFRMIFRRFIRALSQRDHPFVLFLDDLQWADPASLSLMETVLTDDENQHLLIIGAFRDNEVDDSHPLTATLELLETRGAAVTNLSLGPLDSADLLKLLAETLHRSEIDLASFHSLVLKKTGGNPFFVQQFLKTLHHNRGIEFDHATNRWIWDVAAIDAMNITDNVVDLMVRRLQDLPGDARAAMKMAACIGNRFDLNTLSVITAVPHNQIRESISIAMENGLVVPFHERSQSKVDSPDAAETDRRYKFLHDRVQQAAYSLIDEPLKRQAHLDIGRRLMATLPEDSNDSRLFETVDHLNTGRPLMADDGERRKLASLNLRAARKAVAATAYAAGRDYAVVAQQCLTDDRWNSAYELTKELNLVEIDAEYLQGEFERSHSIIETVLVQLRTPLERAELHNTLIIQQTLSGNYQDAIDTTGKALALLGIDLPTNEFDTALDQEMSDYRELLGNRQPPDLIDLHEMSSPEMSVAMRLLGNLCPLCVIANAPLCAVAATKMVNLSLIHGRSPDSAIGFSMFGLMQASVFHEYGIAYQFGKLAMDMADQSGDVSQSCRTSHIFCAYINHWSRPLAEFKSVNSRGFQMGLQSGEHQYAGYHRYNRSLIVFHLGTNLKSLMDDTSEWIQFGRRTRNEHATDCIVAVRRIALDLGGKATSPGAFSKEEVDDTEFVEDLRTRNSLPAFVHYHIMKGQVLYLDGRHDDALRCVVEAETRVSSISGHISLALRNFYESLILIELASDDRREERLETVRRNQVMMKRWADSCPGNFLHKYLLVKAEVTRLEGDDWQVAELYDQAINEAARNGFIQEEALARERAGLFWQSKGMLKVAAVYLSEAVHGYELWGATRKAQAMAETHSELLAGMASRSTSSGSSSTPFFTLVSSSGAALDFATVMKVSRTISGEIDLDGLVKKLIRIAVETAGAQKGMLLLAQNDDLVIEATSTLEQGQTRHSPPIRIDSSGDVPPTVVNLVTRTKEALAVRDATNDSRFVNDHVVQRLGIRSIICLPILLQRKSLGLLYLENNLAADVFTSDRVTILEGLAAQAAISLQNARLYDERRQAELQLREAVDELQALKDRLQAENEYFREEIKTHHKFEEIIGRSSGITKVLLAIETVAPTDATALILGETGTGKELIARAIHNLSERQPQTMVMVNCAALPAGLIESELFGHEKGAFTGALAQKIGRFELADKGTLFLDEIGDLPLELQAKLLRVLQEGNFERVGGTRTIEVDVRVVAATHRNLLEAVEDRTFREDLYYRLNVFPIMVPPLRERRDDIPLLVRHFTLRYANKMGKTISSIPKATIDAMQAYPWPGNVRELQNVIERAVILCRGDRLDVGDWIPERSGRSEHGGVSTLEELERQHITEVLEMTAGRISGDQGAAKILGLKPTTLESRMKKLGVKRSK